MPGIELNMSKEAFKRYSDTWCKFQSDIERLDPVRR